MTKTFGLDKREKLKSRKQIEHLFANGKSFVVFPIRVTYIFLREDIEPVAQIGVTASKRNFKKAVDRNRLKRLMREAYRLQKIELAEILKQKQVKACIFFMYTDKTIAPFDVIKTAVAQCLVRLEKKLDDIHENIA